jgi:DivIVA domain-containing protein
VTWLFVLLAMAVIALVAGVVTGRISAGMEAPVSSSPFRGLPSDAVTPGDLETLRFTPAVRGYRMDEVDQVLDRLAVELHRRDDELRLARTALDGVLPVGDDPAAYAPPVGDAAPADPVPVAVDPAPATVAPATVDPAPPARSEPPLGRS